MAEKVSNKYLYDRNLRASYLYSRNRTMSNVRPLRVNKEQVALVDFWGRATWTYKQPEVLWHQKKLAKLKTLLNKKLGKKKRKNKANK